MDWNEAAKTWDDDPVVRAYAGGAFGSLLELVDGTAGLAGKRVLDFGCGTGLLTAKVAEHADEVVGVDLAEDMVAALAAKGLPNVRALAGDLHDLIDRGAVQPGFDLIVCSSVLAFVRPYPGFVATLCGLLAPGGRFVQWDWELNPADEEVVARITQDAVMRGPGFEDMVVAIVLSDAFRTK